VSLARIDPWFILLPALMSATFIGLWLTTSLHANTAEHQRFAALPLVQESDGVDLLLIPRGSITTADGRMLSIARSVLLGRSEVTQATWNTVMAHNPSRERGDHLPVEWVSWDDCQEFIRRLSLRHGRTYRLPSEDEWAYACHAGSRAGSFDGARETYVHARALAPADACPANAWGLRGMHGNAWEWCADILPDGQRVMRGGSCNLYPVWCPPDDRLSYPAGFHHERRGLRLALDLTD
jgi:formylglycine-generating enzyme required for sulfatase activity